jgi:hypothetical protein
MNILISDQESYPLMLEVQEELDERGLSQNQIRFSYLNIPEIKKQTEQVLEEIDQDKFKFGFCFSSDGDSYQMAINQSNGWPACTIITDMNDLDELLLFPNIRFIEFENDVDPEFIVRVIEVLSKKEFQPE